MKVQTISGVNFGKFVFLSVLVVMLLAIPLAAQLPTGTILGVVKDASGGVVPGATITATNVDNAQARTATSGSDGAFRFSSMPVSHYNIRIEASGFKTSIQTGLVLDVATEVTVNPVLEVGSAAQEVTVTGEAPLVNTSTSSLGGLVNEQQMADLPLNGRNYVDLTLMQAGVTQHANIGTSSGLAGTWFSSNGAPVISNFFTLDGASIVNQFGGGGASFAGTTLGVDGIREYKVITNTFSAEYGMTMGSQVVMVSKGGGNQFHGDVFEYLRNSVFDARNFFDYGYLTAGGRRLPQFQRNNFGGAFGGPIKKDTTFFFGVFEALRQGQGFTALDNVLAPGCKGSAGAVIWNGIGTQPAGSIGPCGQLGNNPSGATLPYTVTIPNASVADFINLYPNPSPGLTNQFTFGARNTTSVNYGQMRVDHTFSASDMAFVRYTIDNAVQTGASPSSIVAASGVAFPGISAQGQSRSQYLSLVENHIFSPSLLNSMRASYSRTSLISWNVFGNSALMSAPYSFVAGFGMGGITTTNLSTIGGSTTNGDPSHPTFHTQNLYTFGDDLNYTKGKNAFKFGFLYNRFGQAEQSQFNSIGALTFTSIARFIAGTPDTISSLTPGSNLNKYFTYNTFGFYGQDDWRVTSRLTLNLGLRWEFMTTPQELNGKQSYLVNLFATTAYPAGYATTPGAAWVYGPVINNTSLHNFSPRVGFAWDVRGNGKTSVRGGSGLFYDVGNLGEYFDQEELTIPPYSSTSTINYGSNGTTILNTPVTYPAGALGTSLHTTDYNYKQPHMLQYNLTVEQQLPGNMGLSVSYVGSRGWSLNSPNSQFNQVAPTAVVNGTPYWDNKLVACQSIVPTCRNNPNWGQVTLQTTDALSWYNSLQVVVNKRLSRGLEFQGAYTYAQALDTGTGALISAECSSSGADAGVYPSNRYLDKGPSCFDVRNNLRFNLMYHFPNMKSDSFVSKLANGWWMGNIVSVQTGYTFTPILASTRSNSSQQNRASVGNASQAVTYGCTPGKLFLYGQPVCPAGGTITLNYVPFNSGTVSQNDPNQWYNPLMFMMSPAITCPGTVTTSNPSGDICQTAGSAGRDILRGPGLGTWNFSLVKDTALKFLGEQGSLQFRAEFFNLLNRANFAMPNGTVFTGKNTDTGSYSEAPASTAGQILATSGTSRQIQLALKVAF